MSNAKLNDFEAYSAARRKRVQTIQRVFAVLSILSFAGTTIAATSHLFLGSPPADQAKVAAPKSQQEQLQQQEQGYLLVLQREPNNQTALEGLVTMQLQRRDFKGVVEPLEKLVKLNPDRLDYQDLLTKMKQKNQGTSSSPPKP